MTPLGEALPWSEFDVDFYDDIDPDFQPTSANAAAMAMWPLMPLIPSTDRVTELREMRSRLASADEKLSALELIHQQIAMLHYQATQLAVDLCDAMPAPKGQQGDEEWGREEIAAALHNGFYAADELVTVGRAVRRSMPTLGRALADGEISYRHVAKIVDGLGKYDLDDETLDRLSSDLVEDAKRCAPATLEKKVRAAAIAAAPDLAEAAAKATKKGRKVDLYPGSAGDQTLAATGPAAEVQLIWTALDACATPRGSDDDRGIDARRFDTLVSWARDALADPSAPRRKGRPVQVNVTMSFGTAFALASRAAELHGYGPITPEVARELARDAKWRVLIVDAVTGALQGLGTESYTPTDRINDFITTRSQTCTHPDCNQPASKCDTDHAIPWPDGPTCTCNLGPDCRRHHRCKHEGGWSVEQLPDGTRISTSPLGRTYVTEPHAYPVD